MMNDVHLYLKPIEHKIGGGNKKSNYYPMKHRPLCKCANDHEHIDTTYQSWSVSPSVVLCWTLIEGNRHHNSPIHPQDTQPEQPWTKKHWRGISSGQWQRCWTKDSLCLLPLLESCLYWAKHKTTQYQLSGSGVGLLNQDAGSVLVSECSAT